MTRYRCLTWTLALAFLLVAGEVLAEEKKEETRVDPTGLPPCVPWPAAGTLRLSRRRHCHRFLG